MTPSHESWDGKWCRRLSEGGVLALRDQLGGVKPQHPVRLVETIGARSVGVGRPDSTAWWTPGWAVVTRAGRGVERTPPLLRCARVECVRPRNRLKGSRGSRRNVVVRVQSVVELHFCAVVTRTGRWRLAARGRSLRVVCSVQDARKFACNIRVPFSGTGDSKMYMSILEVLCNEDGMGCRDHNA